MSRNRGSVLGGNSTRSHGMLLEFVLRLPLMVLVLSCLYAHTDSETSHYTWRLDGDKVMPGPPPPSAPAPDPPPSSSSSDKDGRDNETGNVEQQPSAQELAKMQEQMMEILLSTETAPDGTWKKTWSSSRYCSRCQRGAGTSPDATDKPVKASEVVRNNRGIAVSNEPDDDYDDDDDVDPSRLDDPDYDSEFEEVVEDLILDCGRPVNFTYYDHLVGIQNRGDHPHIPEPEVALTFQKSLLLGSLDQQQQQQQQQPRSSGLSSKQHKVAAGKGNNGSGGAGSKKNSNEVNIDDIERALKKAKREKPKSVELYNQIGNFWRIRGDTQKSIECFRRALAVSPNNADILLNLARVLFNLQYLDDAIVLTRRSLEVQPPDQNAWAQHFQLGEILKAYCHYQEAALHLRHVLELKPNYGPALTALADMEAIPDTTVHVYTVIIIVCLVMGVLAWVLSTLDIGTEELLGFSLTSSKGAAVQANGGTGENGHHHNGSAGQPHKNGKHLQKLRNNGKRS